MKALDTLGRKAGLLSLEIFVASRSELRKIADEAEALCRKASKLAAQLEDAGDMEGRKQAASIFKIANAAHHNALKQWRAP